MDDVDRVVRRKTLKERLGLKGLGCCGSTWGFRPSSMSVIEDEEGPQQQHQQQIEVIDVGQFPPANIPDPDCAAGQITPVASGMNLAAALAAERNLRAAQDSDGVVVGPIGPNENGFHGPSNTEAVLGTPTPFRMSLMRLLEESDGVDGERVKEERGGSGVGCDSVCCVCMGRNKGAAFIPCGHTFCRVCSRELWLNRGSCPLCNRSILEILDIF